MQQYGDEKVIQQLHEWVPLQTHNEYTLIKQNENSYRLETENAYADILFYDFGVMELMIIEKENENNPFYLHFEMNDFEHAKEMINDMIKELLDMKKTKTVKILLCCTGGLTTGFFANKLNQAAKTLSMDYEFSAVSYLNVYVEGFKYDGIFLAPQIAYEYDKIKKALSDKVVCMIPNTIFAKFDPGEMVTFVKDNVEKAKQEKITKKEFVHRKFENTRKILVIAYYSSVEGRHLCFRYYRNGQVVEDGSIKKTMRKDVNDILNIIKVIQAKHPELEEIVLALPGMVSTHHYVYSHFTDEHPDFRQYLRDMFPGLKLRIINHTNAVAYGYNALNDGFEDMAYLYQPIADYNSLAIVKNGINANGRRGILGEMRWAKDFYKYDEDPHELIKTPEGTLKFMLPFLVNIILIAGPEKLLLHGPLLPSLESIHDELVKAIPEPGVPELYELDDEKEYMITGAMLAMIKHGDQI